MSVLDLEEVRGVCLPVSPNPLPLSRESVCAAAESSRLWVDRCCHEGEIRFT